jgi:serine/alanine adding enzyme
MQIELVQTPEQLAQWDAFVRATPGAVHYHLSGWRAVIESTYKNRTVYLMARDPGGRVRGILPLALAGGFPFAPHLVSLPYLSYAGVCADSSEAAEALVAEAESYGSKLGARYVELHNLSEHARPGVALATNRDKLRMVLELPDHPDKLWKALDAKVRNQTRKATKAGLRVETGGVEFLDAFYAVFAQNMRDLGSPVHRADLLRGLFREFASDVRLVMVFKDDLPVGGAIVLRFGDLVEVPWASSRREYFRDCPNNLLYWEILRQCCEQGVRAFDFGRSTRESGTFRFKEQWGAVPVPLYWQFALPPHTTAPDPTHSSLKARMLVRVWQKLPLAIANTLGPMVRGRISA